MLMEEEIPLELIDEQISIAPSLYSHSSIIANIQN